MEKVLIYAGEGASSVSIQQIGHSLSQLNIFNFFKVDSDHLSEENWESHTSLLIFPGGRDIPYHEKLQGKANQKIRAYVEEGGKYLGICAGAYYGCAAFEFEKGSSLEINATRDLQFFPGFAKGPALGNGYFYHDSRSAQIANLQLPDSLSWSYYNGGCFFADAVKYPNVEVLAVYSDLNEAAIIHCQVGKGKAVLSGVHPEYSAQHLKTRDPFLKELIPHLEKIELERLSLFKLLIQS